VVRVSIKLGFHAKERADDATVITSLGGTPTPSGDPDKVKKDSMIRAELQVGRQFDLDRTYRAIDEAFPTTYDTWSLGQGRDLFLSFKSRKNSDGLVIPYGEIAYTTTWDATIDAIADRLVAAQFRGYLCYNHEPSREEGYVAVVNGNHNSGVTTINVDSVPFTPTALPNFLSQARKPDGSVVAVTIDAVGATTLTVEPTPAQIPDNSEIILQSSTESNADFAAAWRKIHDRCEARPGFSGLDLKWTTVFLHSTGIWDMGAGADEKYPGSAYVDVLALDGPYISLPTTGASVEGWMELGYIDWARSKSKPLMVGETHCNEDGGAAAWIGAAQTFLKTLPDLEGWCWFTGGALSGWLAEAPQGSAAKLAAFVTLAVDLEFTPEAPEPPQATVPQRLRLARV
jgi:hypothetical protein